jgi:hypothetical protein
MDQKPKSSHTERAEGAVFLYPCPLTLQVGTAKHHGTPQVHPHKRKESRVNDQLPQPFGALLEEPFWFYPMQVTGKTSIAETAENKEGQGLS